MFKHELGFKCKSIVTGLAGIITSRSENLYGCNRYFIQPPVGSDGKVPDGWWVDEDDLNVTGHAVNRNPKDTGGPMSKLC